MAQLLLPSTLDLATTGDTTPRYSPGTIYEDKNRNVTYIYVKNNEASTALATSAAVVWDGATGRAAGLVLLITNSASKVGGAGMPVAALLAGKFGWIQVKGSCATCTITGASILAGTVAHMVLADGSFITATAGNQVVAVNQGATQTTGANKTLQLEFKS